MPDKSQSNFFPIMIKVWAGASRHDFRYIRCSLPSLLSSDLPDNAFIVLVDDCSTDQRIQPYLSAIAAKYPNIDVWINPHRMGPNTGQAYNFPLLVNMFSNAPYYVLCDDDVIYHPGWLQRLIKVYEEAKKEGLTGIFTALNVPARPSYATIRLPTSEVLLKERQMALNWLVPREVYDTVGPFRDVGVAYDTDYANRMAELKIPVICLKPSYVQNIGYHGAYQTDDTLTAKDFVGCLGWPLAVTASFYAARRRTLQLAHFFYDSVPEGSIKRFVRKMRHKR
jgi:glycosyltransferase involved in cell wall biosynthesis